MVTYFPEFQTILNYEPRLSNLEVRFPMLVVKVPPVLDLAVSVGVFSHCLLTSRFFAKEMVR